MKKLKYPEKNIKVYQDIGIILTIVIFNLRDSIAIQGNKTIYEMRVLTAQPPESVITFYHNVHINGTSTSPNHVTPTHFLEVLKLSWRHR